MKIAFLGNFKVSYSSESHYLETLKALGHEVSVLQEDRVSSRQIERQALDADVFFWVHTHGWMIEGIEDVLKKLKVNGVPTVGYHLDLWMGVDRFKDLKSDPYWKIDYFFTVDSLFADYLNERDELPKAFFLPAGVFDKECYIGEYKKEYAHDVIFVGSINYHKEWPYRYKLIKRLRETFGNRFAHYGKGGLGIIRGEDLNNLYASAKVVVGDTLCKNYDYPYYLSDRVFETTGRGGFIIHPYVRGIEEFFKIDMPEQELVTYKYGDFENLEKLIEKFVKEKELREEIKMRGHWRTKNNHTYRHRLSKILKMLKDEEEK